MKIATATIIALLVGLTPMAKAQMKQREGFGIGVIVGEPTGLSLKKWINDTQAIDMGLAWSFSENDSLHLHADFLLHTIDLLQDSAARGDLPVYVGIGGRLKLKEDNHGNGRNDHDDLFGIRMPVGISYLLEDAPVEFFGEIVPVFDVAPDSDFDLNAAIGARFYF